MKMSNGKFFPNYSSINTPIECSHTTGIGIVLSFFFKAAISINCVSSSEQGAEVETYL